MKISEFRAGINDLRAALRNWGVVKQAGELESLASALEEFDDLTIAELVKKLRAINTSPATPKAPRPLNVAAIDHYLAILKDAAHSSDAFDRAVEQVIADKKQLPPAELKELARQFGGSVPERSSRAAISTFLKARRLEMRRQDGLGATIDRMFGRS